MKRSGQADLPLHHGHVPSWLYERMALLGGAIVESVVQQYGKQEVLKRLSDPFWFQSFGSVLGMDWHSSGITTSVLGALKKSINPISRELGIFICGGKGKNSRQTPLELLKIADTVGLDGRKLVRTSKLTAKVDNTAIQDGFQLYLHSFIVSDQGEWAVIQQGMNDVSGMARRYHWHSENVSSFVENPHSSIYGVNQGLILNLTDSLASPTRAGILQIAHEKPALMIPEIKKLVMPRHHEVRENDVDLKRLGAVLAVAHEREITQFEDFLLLEGLGPRILQSVTLVSEIIHGTPSRFKDPARFAFAHGGKDGHPFPVPIKVYDESIQILKNSVEKARIGFTDKQKAIKKLSDLSRMLEKDFVPNNRFEEIIRKEREESHKYGGRTVLGKAKPPVDQNGQLKLF